MTTRMVSLRIALYPGSFDPVTRGHLDIVERALHLFDLVYIGIGKHPGKTNLFSAPERIRLIQESLTETGIDAGRAPVIEYGDLMTRAAARLRASAIVRGLRGLSDFEAEFQLAHTTKRLLPEIEPIFLMTAESNFYVSSSLVKELVRFGADLEEVQGFVPDCVATALFDKMKETE